MNSSKSFWFSQLTIYFLILEKTLKDIITNGRWNWYGVEEEQEEESMSDNCYTGLFWDMDTREFLRWNELKKEGKLTESESTE